MSNSISLLGLQWGDEGKGKVVDLLSKDIDAAVRYQGGHNAGHTLIIDGKEVVFHLLPSSICHKNIKCFLGRGVVISLEALFSEIDDAFEFIGDLKDRLVVSNAACLIQPYHKKIDQLRERSRSGTKIGTTGRGIGPAYEDRVGRRSIRVADLYDPNALKVKLEEALDIYNFLIKRHDEDQQEDLNELLDENLKQAERLKPFVGNVIAELKAFQESNKTILFEGAQGALLDYSLGTYPFVTSSNSSLGGIASGAGVSATSIDYSLGICKAYTTRVGEGPFPTELNDEIGSYLAEKGGEVGATTGRPRRCGWLDAVLLSHTVYLNGINGICLTKIDVLDGLEKIKICSDYSSSLSREDILESLALNDIEPQYIELEGWQEPTAGVQRFEDLNDKAIDFIAKVEELCGAPIVMISTGPRREDAIIRKYPL
ncbi:MAG TPA: adenylosuccinate synthase [Gammaproteobacteria bacterium]|jgi:adenylosuccinate synthase|nr:adenylosuccinate synthase [Gammaproteobacteria bacterium]HIA43788.1 adenylosuccinate synthase [Gammaproteobacteria bacterium]HIA95837.1 adenylosuccinate synthase [Gammaproteobacteria bacterium]HIB74267.1 adenylosuccinate synthase [Gammaproteobacteria bacterium]HIG49630.1 adenylosuccinate synthase [Gammaproteobacteria bacterium]